MEIIQKICIKFLFKRWANPYHLSNVKSVNITQHGHFKFLVQN